MATILSFGPYYHAVAGGLAPRRAVNLRWMPSDHFSVGVITASGHPNPARRNMDYALWVSDSSVITRDIGSGDISNVTSSFAATFFNSANVGETTINDFAFYLSIVKP